MTPYRVYPIACRIASEVRQSRLSPRYGYPVFAETAREYEPCRSCLRTFEIGKESRLLFTYNSFAGLDSYPSPGPVFIHEQPCEPFAGNSKFPEHLRTLALTLEGYGRDRWMVARERPDADGIEAVIDELLGNPTVSYIHIRSTAAGCYIARIERN